MQFTVPIPHDPEALTIKVEAVSFVQAKAKAYRMYAEASRLNLQALRAATNPLYAALSPAAKLVCDGILDKRALMAKRT